jgi:hypothetical protein
LAEFAPARQDRRVTLDPIDPSLVDSSPVDSSPVDPNRRWRRDPGVLVAWVVLGVLAATAVIFTAVSRTPAPAGFLPPSTSAPDAALPRVSLPNSGRATPSDAAPLAPPTPSAATLPCPASGVRMRTGQVDAAMGLRAMGLELVNCGAKPIVLNGYPAIRVLDAEQRPSPTDVIKGRSAITALDSVDAPPRPVTVKPGGSAWTTLVWRNTVTDSSVVATNGDFLLVEPGDGKPAQVVPVTDHPIDLGNTGRLGVGPWQPPPAG